MQGTACRDGHDRRRTGDTDVTPRRQHEPFLVGGDPGELLHDRAPLLCAHAAVEHDEVPRELRELRREAFEMVLPLRQQDR